MKYNINGIKYFMQLCTNYRDNKYYMSLPEEIKILIWDIIHRSEERRVGERV